MMLLNLPVYALLRLPQGGGRTRSLLVGINYGHHKEKKLKLFGCHKDVEKMKQFIESQVSAFSCTSFHEEAGRMQTVRNVGERPGIKRPNPNDFFSKHACFYIWGERWSID